MTSKHSAISSYTYPFLFPSPWYSSKIFLFEVVPTDATVEGPLRLVRSRIRRLFGKIQRFHVPLQCFLGLRDSHHASRVDSLQVNLQHQCKIECFSETWLSLSWFP